MLCFSAMPENKIIRSSPWLYALQRKRDVVTLRGTENADVAIIGGGIAGVSTAYFLLTRTNRSVALVERSKVAHGSSGNNAGTATPIFERSLSHFIDLFGVERSVNGYRAVEKSWEFLDEMHLFTGVMDMPVHVPGYFGYWNSKDVAPVLAENELRVSLGLEPKQIFYAAERKSELAGPLAEQPWLSFVPSKLIAEKLRTQDSRLVACLVENEALVDSGALSERTTEELLKRYPDRFRVYEESSVTTISFSDGSATVASKDGTLQAKDVVLSTNGFEQFELMDAHESTINARFHKNVTSRLAYMVGIFDPERTPEPASLAYIYKPEDELGISFEYVTERAFMKDGVKGSLLSIGGPDSLFNHERAEYGHETPFRQGVLREMERFLEHHYDLPLRGKEHFLWHGLLGYTDTNARLVGKDPRIGNLYYNLGCNGVGILLSLWGGNTLARDMLGETIEKTMFDPATHFSDSLNEH